jgi:hypothetical protein
MNFTKDNWYSWQYDGEKFGKPDGGKLKTFYSKTDKHLTFKEALIENARATVDAFPNEQLDLMFSGGIDSEIILQAFKEIGHPIRVNIFKYENAYNFYDVQHALRACQLVGIKPNVIDFNLEKFYENDAYDLMCVVKCSHARAMPHLAFMDYVDGIPIFGSGDPRFYRPHDNYSEKATWLVQDAEYDIAWFRYAEMIERQAIMQWLKWTPEVVASMTETKWFKALTNDEYPGKLGPNSTKIEGYREAFPLEQREKRTGFELTDKLVLPVQKAHHEKFGVIYGQMAERTVPEFLEEIWVK